MRAGPLQRFATSASILFAVALLLRVAASAVLDAPRLAQAGVAFDFGAEAACLADSIHRHGQFGDPWGHGTGPSSWLTPPYPALVAMCLELGGGITRASAWWLFCMQAVLSALTAVVLVRLGQRVACQAAGWVAGWAWALYPVAIWNAAHVVWDTTLVALAMVLFAWQLLSAPSRTSVQRELGLGLGLGLAAFVNPAPLAFGPAILLVLWRRDPTPSRFVRSALLLGVGTLLVVAPWMLRNQRVLGAATLRPNFGVELRIGNHDEATGHPVPFRYHPSHIPEELAKYKALGEVEYARENSQRAWHWIREHPGSFLRLSLQRTMLFWVGDLPLIDERKAEGGSIEPAGDWNSWLKWIAFAGLGLCAWIGLGAKSVSAAARGYLAWGMVAFTLPYSITHVSERYRFPIDPLLVLVASAWIVACFRSLQAKTTRPPDSKGGSTPPAPWP